MECPGKEVHTVVTQRRVTLGGQPLLYLPNTKPVGDLKTSLVQLLKRNNYEKISDSPEAQSAIQVLFSTHNNLRQHIYHDTKSGDDPDDFLYTMDGYRECLEDMGQPVPDERYEDIILQALPAEYKRVRTASYERRDFYLADT